jgi:hypothetical protein
MSGPGLQGIDALTSAMVTNIIPDQEYLLQVIFSLGSIPGAYSPVGTTVPYSIDLLLLVSRYYLQAFLSQLSRHYRKKTFDIANFFLQVDAFYTFFKFP